MTGAPHSALGAGCTPRTVALVLAYAIALFAVFHAREFSRPARAFLDTSRWNGSPSSLASFRITCGCSLRPPSSQRAMHLTSSTRDPGSRSPAPWACSCLLVGSVAFAIVARQRRSPALAFALVWVAVVARTGLERPLSIGRRARRTHAATWRASGSCLVAGVAAERFLLSEARHGRRGDCLGRARVRRSDVDAHAGVARRSRVRARRSSPIIPSRTRRTSPPGVALKGANALEQADRELTIARQLFPRDSVVYHEAADLAERQRRPAAAAALRDSARIARTIPYASNSFGSGARR